MRNPLIHPGVIAWISEKSLVGASVALYAWGYCWMYQYFLAPTSAYMGFAYHPPDLGALSLAWFLALIPALWMPLRLTRPSIFCYWTLYLVCYVPSVFTPLYMALTALQDTRAFQLTLLLSMAIVGICYLIPVSSLRLKSASPRLFWAAVYLFVALATVWMFVEFRNTMRLVTLDYIYDVRREAKLIFEGSLVGYVLLPMGLVINPLLMSRGIRQRRMSEFLIGASGEVLILACTGLKVVILAVPAVLGASLAVKYGRRHFGLLLATFTAACFGIFVLLTILYHGRSIPVDALLLTIVERMFGSPGLVSSLYYHFFLSHPLTHLSHVKGFNLLIHYPYEFPLGYEIGNFYVTRGTALNINAHFWVGDGVAAFGLPGMILVSALVSGILWIVDWVSSRHDIRFTAPLLVVIAYQLTNMSIFTLLASGGLGGIIAMLLIMPPDPPPRVTIPKRWSRAGTKWQWRTAASGPGLTD